MVGFFDNAYRDGGIPTWDIGRPQGALVRLAGSGLVVGSVLDVGCGTGENALHLAGRGHAVLGVDFATAAIERATA
jgi:2-polyprenyl-3-methyl-5-hydroxy-6-metoxy-1,4-benzoquinol methylase